jgi:hypothetical protein
VLQALACNTYSELNHYIQGLEFFYRGMQGADFCFVINLRYPLMLRFLMEVFVFIKGSETACFYAYPSRV